MFNLDDILRGYSNEQYNEAQCTAIMNFLNYKGIIDIKEYIEFYQENFTEILKGIIKRDKEERQKKREEFEKQEKDQ